MWTKEGINNDDSNNLGKHEHGVRTDKEVGGKDGKNTWVIKRSSLVQVRKIQVC